MDNILTINTSIEFREWLTLHSQTEKECWLILKHGKPQPDDRLYYLDAIETALCFGWIDSIKKIINGEHYQRFSPRAKNGYWSALNSERVKRLIKLGLMTPQGLNVLPDNFDKKEINYDFLLKETDEEIVTLFQKLPLLYQKIRIYNLEFTKKTTPKLYPKSLQHFINMTKIGKTYGQWNDYGRLE